MTKTNRLTVTVLLAFLFQLFFGQNKIIFNVDTTRDGKGYELFGSFPNRKDKGFILCDRQFKNDSIIVLVNNKVKSSEILTTQPNGYTTEISFPKTKKMLITIILNRRVFESFEFNQDFCVAHLNYRDNQLFWTYTNKIFAYD